jgi:chromosome segregation ATPase
MMDAADEIERERKAHMELAASYHDATEEIERLRRELEDDCLYKKECERLKGALELEKQASRDVAATYNEQEAEIERLEATNQTLELLARSRLTDVEAFKVYSTKLEQEIERLREALDWIADTPMKWTKPQGDVYWANMAMALAKKADDARTALQKDTE